MALGLSSEEETLWPHAVRQSVRNCQPQSPRDCIPLHYEDPCVDVGEGPHWWRSITNARPDSDREIRRPFISSALVLAYGEIVLLEGGFFEIYVHVRVECQVQE